MLRIRFNLQQKKASAFTYNNMLTGKKDKRYLILGPPVLADSDTDTCSLTLKENQILYNKAKSTVIRNHLCLP